MSVDTDAAPRVEPAAARMRQSLVLLFAVACGVSAANLYYAQPVLPSIAKTFGTSSGNAGLVVTFAQIGYAAGLVLLVPLGDLLPRRRLVPVLLLAATAGLIASALAPDVGVLVAVALLVGAGAVAAQVLVPMAATLAGEARRGHVVGTVMSGLLLGILLARTVSGLVGGLSSWRFVYGLAAVLTATLAFVLSRVLPAEGERPHISYGGLLRTALHLLLSESLLQRRAFFGGLVFAAFSVFWTTMAFVLAGGSYHYGEVTIGLFGLVGAGGALCANFAGRWADQGRTKLTTLVFALCIAVSFGPLWVGRHNLTMMIIGILVLDVGVQGMQVTNQSMIYRLAPHLRSRITSAYMACYFAGGAIGSALGGWVYGSHGWAGVCYLGAGIGIVATVAGVIDAIRAHPTHSATSIA
jgi:predicted MFS family arabinose efflux permease